MKDILKQGILVLNAGSSSLKFALYSGSGSASSLKNILRGQIAGIGNKSEFKARNTDGKIFQLSDNHSDLCVENHIDAITLVLHWIHQQVKNIQLMGVGHRVVHGGRNHKMPVLITDQIITELESLCPLAPHHQPHNLSAIRAIQKMDASLPQVACFDTAFHANQSEVACRLPLPRRYQEKGLMRYGFHGLSYEYITSVIPEYNNGELPERLIVAHLGNGASLSAIKNGIGIATTMGFSTLDGIIMGTRCGSIDPGVLLYLMNEEKMDEADLSELIYNQCGLLGLSGISSDMQILLESSQPQAAEAIESFCYSVEQSLGSLIMNLGGLDGLVFTGGIGEHAAAVRSKIYEKLKWLGLVIDDNSNSQHGPLISTEDSAIRAWVIPTDEELIIARHSFKTISILVS